MTLCRMLVHWYHISHMVSGEYLTQYYDVVPHYCVHLHCTDVPTFLARSYHSVIRQHWQELDFPNIGYQFVGCYPIWKDFIDSSVTHAIAHLPFFENGKWNISLIEDQFCYFIHVLLYAWVVMWLQSVCQLLVILWVYLYIWIDLVDCCIYIGTCHEISSVHIVHMSSFFS